MKQEAKTGIMEALKAYASENKLKKKELSRITGVSESYIHCILNGQIAFEQTEIGDIHFKKVSKAIGHNIEKEYWIHQDTPQYLRIYSELLDAKAFGRMKKIIGKTRCGKTYTVEHFKKKQPNGTYVITVSSVHRLKDIINEICDLLKLDISGSYVSRMKRITAFLRDKKMKGNKPVLIFDEAENMTLPVLKALKGLYDNVKDVCPIVLIGTPQLEKKLALLEEKDIEGMPQFATRFRAGYRPVEDIDKEETFIPFLDALVEDENLKVLLFNLANNYGELNDYLSHALQAANQMGEPLTEDLFKQLNDL